MPLTARTAVRNFCQSLLRKKRIGQSVTKLDRCLSTGDLIFLGIGSTLGLGVYVLAGQVASTKSGPAVTLSFLVAAIASVFAGLCYAEFGARVPRAGSAYIYSYVTVGELMAFIIGWNLVLEYVIGTASVARGYSGYIDSLFNETMRQYLKTHLPMHVEHFSEYPDFLSFGITLVLTVVLAFGVKESLEFNTLFTGLNLLVVVFVILCGSFKAQLHNWQLTKEEIPPNNGEGGFFPYGFDSMMAGAATCFYGFVGFDCVATTGEEAKNPQKAIPISIIVSLLFVFLSYFAVSAVQTLMWPYWDLNQGAPLPYAFHKVGFETAGWIISFGAIFGLSTSLLGAMFPLPRILYAMATDGVIFRGLAHIHPKFKTPVLATFLSGIFAGFMAMIFNVNELADMMSIGTLLAYTLVAACVLILRYKESTDYMTVRPPLGVPDSRTLLEEARLQSDPLLATADETVTDSVPHHTRGDIAKQIFNLKKLKAPILLSSKIATALVIIIGISIIVLDSLLVFLHDNLINGDILSICLVIIALVILIILTIALWRQPTNKTKISFMVPCIPFIPVLSIFINVYLMLKLSPQTWIRFSIWMGVGFLIYFLYGIRHSEVGRKRRKTKPRGEGHDSRKVN